MKRIYLHVVCLSLLAFVPLTGSGCHKKSTAEAAATATTGDAIKDNANLMVDQGKQIFRFDTFGSEAFWGGTLQLHSAISGSANGGVGPGVSPATALSVGLKVDFDALPANVVTGLTNGTVDLNDPKTTLALLQAKAVVGVTGIFDANGTLTSLGIQCSLCHSTVDNAFSAGIGHRLDGWNNQDLNVGAIVDLSPNLAPVATLLGVDVPTVHTVLQSWGPGKFDAELFMDGKAFNPQQVTNGVVTATNVSAATLIPPAYGLAGVNLHTSAGWGSVTYWNAFVGNLEMHGKGTFFDPRLKDAVKFPVAARAGFDNVRSDPDLITSKLAALQVYQLVIPAPAPPAGSFDAATAARGQALFTGKAKCATCHVPPLFTEPGWNMHTPAEVGVDSFQADRSPDGRYRTTPLKGLWSHMKRGFYHDGRFATLADVINHYDTLGALGLTAQEKLDLAEYLKSI